MFFNAYAFKGQVHVFAGWVKILSPSSCRTSAIFKYIVPWTVLCNITEALELLDHLQLLAMIKILKYCILLAGSMHTENSSVVSAVSTIKMIVGSLFWLPKEFYQQLKQSYHFSIKFLLVIFFSVTFTKAYCSHNSFSLHLNLLLCWHGFKFYDIITMWS